MELEYYITEKLQKELAARGELANKLRVSTISDTDIADIIKNSELVTVDFKGLVTMKLTENAVKAYVQRQWKTPTKQYVRIRGLSIVFDYEIKTASDLRQALAEIKKREDVAQSEVDEKNKQLKLEAEGKAKADAEKQAKTEALEKARELLADELTAKNETIEKLAQENKNLRAAEEERQMARQKKRVSEYFNEIEADDLEWCDASEYLSSDELPVSVQKTIRDEFLDFDYFDKWTERTDVGCGCSGHYIGIIDDTKYSLAEFDE